MESSESNTDHYATNYYEIANYKQNLLNGLSVAILWSNINNCIHMICTTCMAVIAKNGMLRNMKETTQFLAFFPDFLLLWKKKKKKRKIKEGMKQMSKWSLKRKVL